LPKSREGRAESVVDMLDGFESDLFRFLKVTRCAAAWALAKYTDSRAKLARLVMAQIFKTSAGSAGICIQYGEKSCMGTYIEGKTLNVHALRCPASNKFLRSRGHVA